MGHEAIRTNNRRGAIENAEPLAPDPELQAEIVETLADMRSPTKQYVKSKRIAGVLGGDVATTKVGQQLRLLSLRDEPIVEEWCRGNGSRTWRILLEVDG